MRGCCQSIGLDWNTPAEMENHAISALVQVIRDASPSDWSSVSLEMFAGLIQLRFLQNKCFIRSFDEDWFTDPANSSATMYDLSAYLADNAINLG
jgi:hypothetical protein